MRNAIGAVSLTAAAVLATMVCWSLRGADASVLQGTWKGQEVGRPTEGTCCLTVSGNTLDFRGADTNESYRCTFTLREDQNPKQLVAVITSCPAPQYIGKTAYAIYRIETGTLTLTGNEPGNGEVPKSFDAPGARKFVLKKS